MNHILYGIIYNTTGEIVYYGITSNFEARVSSHFATSSWNDPNSLQWNKPLYRAFRKHGVENFSIHILETYSSREEVATREAELVPRDNKEVWPRYNAYPGGDATEVWVMNILTKKVEYFERAYEASAALDITPQNLNSLLNRECHQIKHYVAAYRESDLEALYRNAWERGSLGLMVKLSLADGSYEFVEPISMKPRKTRRGDFLYLTSKMFLRVNEIYKKERNARHKYFIVDTETGDYFYGRNMAEVGRSIGLSRERVRQIKNGDTKKYRPADDIETILLSFRA